MVDEREKFASILNETALALGADKDTLGQDIEDINELMGGLYKLYDTEAITMNPKASEFLQKIKISHNLNRFVSLCHVVSRYIEV